MTAGLYRAIGALLFATALAYTAYVFAIVWASTAPASGGSLGTALSVNAMAFTAFATHHSLLARASVKRRLTAIVREENQRTLFVWTASLLLLGVLASWREVGHVVYTTGNAAALLLWMLRLFGIVVLVQAARVINPLELAGLREPRGRLEVSGPYRLVRHPVYLGLLLLVWTPVTMTGDRLTFAALTTVYLAVAIPLEEQSMRHRIGAAYDTYRARVRWRIAPGVY